MNRFRIPARGIGLRTFFVERTRAGEIVVLPTGPGDGPCARRPVPMSPRRSRGGVLNEEEGRHDAQNEAPRSHPAQMGCPTLRRHESKLHRTAGFIDADVTRGAVPLTTRSIFP